MTGIQEVNNLILYRVDNIDSLLPIADIIDAFRNQGLKRNLPRFAVIVLPVGSSRDPFVKELEMLSLRHIGVQIDDTSSFEDMVYYATNRRWGSR